MSWSNDLYRADEQLKAVDEAIGRSLKAAAKAGGEVLATEAQTRAPYRTGRLKVSISTKFGSIKQTAVERVVFAKEFYAMFLEFGTSRAAARPFLRPAADNKQDEIARAMQDEVMAEIRKGLAQ